MKNIIFGTSDTWSTSRLLHRPIDQGIILKIVGFMIIWFQDILTQTFQLFNHELCKDEFFNQRIGKFTIEKFWYEPYQGFLQHIRTIISTSTMLKRYKQ